MCTSLTLSFSCSDSFTLTVFMMKNTTMCELTRVFGHSILAFCGNTWQEDLTIDTSVLDPDTFNNPRLGLYYDPQPMIALGLVKVEDHQVTT